MFVEKKICFLIFKFNGNFFVSIKMFVSNIIVAFLFYYLAVILGSNLAATADDGAIHTELVDANNRKQILAMFNLTEAQMSRIYAGINAANKEAEANGSVYFKNIKEFR